MDEELKKAKKRAKKILTSTSSEVDEITRKVALDIEAIAIVQIKEMAAMLKEQVRTSQEDIKAELEEYKKARMAEIDEQVKLKVLEISKQVLGDAIDLKAHEELVIKALENAKRNGIL